MRTFTILSILTLLLTRAFAGSQHPTVFIHANIISMEKEGILSDQTLIVRRGKIESLGKSGTVLIPGDATTIDATGKYLIPGLTDMHVHLSEPEDMMLWLSHGITTVLNLNGSPTHLQWKKEINEGRMEGPTLYTSCPTIYTANTAREGDSLAQTYHDAGYDCLKIYNQVTTPAFNAIIANAKRNNMITVGHIVRAPGYEAVIRSGMAVAHAEEYMYTAFQDTLSYARIPSVVALTRESGIPVIATLTTYEAITMQVENLDSVLAQPGLQYIAPWILATWSAENNRYSIKQGFHGGRLEGRLTFQDTLIAQMHRAGVPILVGTDCVFNGLLSGRAALRETERLARIGFTPYDALKAATVDAAKFLRSESTFGTISVGKSADMVLLNRNPLESLAAIEDQAGVMARGNWYTKKDLQEKLDALPARYEAMQSEFDELLKSDLSAAIRYEIDRDPFALLMDPQFIRMAEAHRGTEIVKFLSLIRRTAPDFRLAKEQVINELGYRFMNKKLFNEAVAVLRLNTELFPNSANTYDSYGEALLNDGDIEGARVSYQHALSLDPSMESSIKALEKIK